MSRLPVKKTYKLYIGGAFPRSESGRTYLSEGQNVARASRKDLRDAVRAARTSRRGTCTSPPASSSRASSATSSSSTAATSTTC